MTSRQEWEAYLIPGTQTLRNKFVTDAEPYGVSDQKILELLERGATKFRMVELAHNPIEGNFDYEHMKAIHRHIFQDVYEWAGQERTVSMSKAGYRYWPAGPGLKEAADHRYELLAQGNFLRGLDRESFVSELAEHWAEINVVHSFREGNTRSQFMFFRQLSRQAGWDLDTARFAHDGPLREPFVAARFEAQRTGSSEALRRVLDHAVSPIESPSNAAAPSEEVLRRLDVYRTGAPAKISPIERDLARRIEKEERGQER
ncbi:Fic/DOC family protein [Trueperella pyogenes]